MCRDFGTSLLYFPSFTFLIILQLKEKSISAQASDCTIAPDLQGRLKGNCAHKEITSVPQTLDPKIQILDISFNNISALNKDDLKTYSNLEGLVMIKLPVESFPNGFFQFTPLLRMLNISNTQIKNWNEIPVSIVELNFTRCDYEMLDFSHLVNLKELYLKGCYFLKRVPLLPSTAPLEKLNMRDCDLTELEYEQVAPFCRLRFLGMSSKKLLDEKHMERCCSLRRWAIANNISGYYSLICGRTVQYPSCNDLDIKFSEESKKQRAECLQTLKPGGNSNLMVIVISTIIAAALISISIAIFLLYHYKIHLPKTKGKGSSVVTESEVEPEYDGNFPD